LFFLDYKFRLKNQRVFRIFFVLPYNQILWYHVPLTHKRDIYVDQSKLTDYYANI